MTPLDAQAEALRQAAAEGDFAAAQSAAAGFASLLEPLLAELPPAEAERRLREACELIGWARRPLCAARERIVEEMRRLENLRTYHERLSGAIPESGAHRFRIEG